MDWIKRFFDWATRRTALKAECRFQTALADARWLCMLDLQKQRNQWEEKFNSASANRNYWMDHALELKQRLDKTQYENSHWSKRADFWQKEAEALKTEVALFKDGAKFWEAEVKKLECSRDAWKNDANHTATDRDYWQGLARVRGDKLAAAEKRAAEAADYWCNDGQLRALREDIKALKTEVVIYKDSATFWEADSRKRAAAAEKWMLTANQSALDLDACQKRAEQLMTKLEYWHGRALDLGADFVP